MPESREKTKEREKDAAGLEPESTVRPAKARRISPALIAALVVAIAVAVVAVILIKIKKAPEQHVGSGEKVVYSAEWLDIPTIDVSGIHVSVPLDASGAQRRGLNVGVVIYLAPAHGHKGKIKELNKEVIPRVNNLKAKFRSVIIDEIISKDYGDLSNAEKRSKMLNNFRENFRQIIKSCELDKHVDVDTVIWKDFDWEL